MLKNIKKRNEGFTIIEVLIVLAIAGLILLVVFLAVPALQRNSRNTQRKNDVAAILGAYQEYVNNKGGTPPSAASDFINNAKLGIYSAGNVDYDASNTAISGSTELTVEKVHVRSNAKCNANNDNVGGANASTRSVAIVYTVESGGGTTNICTES